MTDILFIFLVILMVFCLMLFGIILNYLKNNHHKEWEEIGSPSIFINNSIRNSIRSNRYFFRSQYKKLNDHKLNNLCLTHKCLTFIYFAIFITLLFIIPTS